MRKRRRVLCVFETLWDRKQLEACRAAWDDRFEIVFPEPVDADCLADFDVLGFIERAVTGEFGPVDGVITSSDYPGAPVCAAISQRLGLSGATPLAVLRASHKWYSRLIQEKAVPEAVPGFTLLDPKSPTRGFFELGFPCFVKPVKGSFSLLARRADTGEQLDTFLASPEVQEFSEYYVRMFNRLLAEFSDFEVGGGHFIAEQILRGDLVTVEGYVWDGRPELLGIVDSVVHPEHRSFLRFEYPSSLSDRVQERMAELARRTVAALGLDRTLFNIEMTYDPDRDRIGIIEVNPRICGQFGDLYRKVDGTSGYEIALALCAGERPVVQRGQGAHAYACSVPLRIFEPSALERGPSEDDVSAAEKLFPGTLVWIERHAGETLSEFGSEDGASARYGVVNLGAPDRASLQTRARAIEERLGFSFRPLSR